MLSLLAVLNKFLGNDHDCHHTSGGATHEIGPQNIVLIQVLLLAESFFTNLFLWNLF